MFKEIGKGILKNAATAYGTRLLVERIVPAAEGLGSKIVKKVKNLSSPKDEAEPSVSPEEVQKFKNAATRVVNQPSKIIDAEVED